MANQSATSTSQAQTSFSKGLSGSERSRGHLEQTRSAAKAFREKDTDPNKAARREAFMVKRSQPFPEHKPSPELAAGVDARSFNQRWEAERRDAAQAQPKDQNKDASREERKAAFKMYRRAQLQSHFQSPTQAKGPRHER